MDAVLAAIKKHPAVKSTDPVGCLRLVTKEAEASESGTDRLITVVATTAATDLDEQVVLPGGADKTYFDAIGQKKVFVDHMYGTDYCVGVARYVNPWMDKGAQVGWKCGIHVYRGLRNPRADDVWEMAKQGGMGVSIGFIPLEVGPLTDQERKMYKGATSIVRRWKWLELSFTPLPCNVQAQSVSIMEAPAVEIELPEVYEL